MFNIAKKFFNETEAEENYGNLSLVETPSCNIALRTLRSLDACQECANLIISGNVVLVSYTELNREASLHAADYLAGICYIIEASITKIGRDMLLYTPVNIEVENRRRKN